MALSRDDILNVQDIEIEEVEVPEWGGVVFVKGMTGAERDEFEAQIVEQRGSNVKTNMTNIRAKLAAKSICDEDGKLLFTSKDVKALGRKSAQALDRVFSVAQRLSGVTSEDVDELAENFDANPSDGSASD